MNTKTKNNNGLSHTATGGSNDLSMSTRVIHHSPEQWPNKQTTVIENVDRETFLKLCSAIWGGEFQQKVENMLHDFPKVSVEIWDGQMQGIFTGTMLSGHRESWSYRTIYRFTARQILNTTKVREEVRARVEESNRRMRAEIAAEYGY